MDQLFGNGLEVSAFFEMTPDLVCIAGKDGYFKKVNPAVINKLGYSRAELFEKPIDYFVHPDDRERTREERRKLHSGSILLNFENRYISKSNQEVWLEWTSIYFAEKELVFAIAKDITARKRAEQEIAERFTILKSMATHFKASIERDRKNFAAELHEELAQLATVIKMDLDWLQTNHEHSEADGRDRLEHARLVSELLIHTIRRISFSVSPLMLDDLGLSATLEWQCNEFTILNGIPCHYEHQFDEKRLTQEMRMDIFRIFQESMVNIANHAGASRVHVTLTDHGDQLELRVSDNGKGFHPANLEETSGLARMQNRARSINAQLDVDSNTIGTTVRLIIPL